MSGGSPLNNIPPALLQLLVQRLMQQQQQQPQGGGMPPGSQGGLPMGNSGQMQPGMAQLLQMQQAANAQPMRSDIATGLPMGNSGMMQPGMQQLLALRDASLAQPQGAAAGAGPAAGNMLPGGAPALDYATALKMAQAGPGAQWQGPGSAITMPGQSGYQPLPGMAGGPTAPQPQVQPPKMPSMKKGGMVKKTGPHFLHKGERVVPAAKVSAKSKPKAVVARAPMKHPSAKSAPVRTPIKHASAKHKGRK
jgi:hypothetical protein